MAVHLYPLACPLLCNEVANVGSLSSVSHSCRSLKLRMAHGPLTYRESIRTTGDSNKWQGWWLSPAAGAILWDWALDLWDLQVDRLVGLEWNWIVGSPACVWRAGGLFGVRKTHAFGHRSVLGEQQSKRESLFSSHLNNPNTGYLFIPVPSKKCLNNDSNIYSENKITVLETAPLVRVITLQMLKCGPQDKKRLRGAGASAGGCAGRSLTGCSPTPHSLSLARGLEVWLLFCLTVWIKIRTPRWPQILSNDHRSDFTCIEVWRPWEKLSSETEGFLGIDCVPPEEHSPLSGLTMAGWGTLPGRVWLFSTRDALWPDISSPCLLTLPFMPSPSGMPAQLSRSAPGDLVRPISCDPAGRLRACRGHGTFLPQHMCAGPLSSSARTWAPSRQRLDFFFWLFFFVSWKQTKVFGLG